MQETENAGTGVSVAVGVSVSVGVGVIVAVLIHALNIVLGAFSPTIHSMRLHYVEFFKLFFEGGGRPFTPFTLAVEPDQGAAARQ